MMSFKLHLLLPLLICVIPSIAYWKDAHHLPNSNPMLQPDRRTLDQLYASAKREIGNASLVIYAGGDLSSQQNMTRNAFEARFKGIKLEIIVDLSKFHDVRLDYQLELKRKTGKRVIPDVIQLQTIHNFPRWKRDGVLLQYKTIEWDSINEQLKDVHGAYTGVLIFAYGNNLNMEKLKAARIEPPTEAMDYLDPKLANKLVMTYPNDDDAVLFLFYKITQQHGMNFLRGLVAQNVTWVRGTQGSLDLVRARKFLATMTSANSLALTPGQPVFVLPKKSPFVMWPQRAAILKDTPYPETAKLYMSWMVSLERQKVNTAFSVRDDVPPPENYKSIWNYPNGNPIEFEIFMRDREVVERFKNQVALFIGEPIGPNPSGNLGPQPTKAVF